HPPAPEIHLAQCLEHGRETHLSPAELDKTIGTLGGRVGGRRLDILYMQEQQPVTVFLNRLGRIAAPPGSNGPHPTPIWHSAGPRLRGFAALLRDALQASPCGCDIRARPPGRRY